MIFSRLFTPAYKSPEAAKRKEAIKTLNTEKPEEKSVLHELAFNDADPDVSLAALEKLDSFALWQKMSQIAAVDKIKRVAMQRVERGLFDEDQTLLTDTERKAYLLESAGSDLIARAIEVRSDLLADTAFTVSLCERMAKPSFTQRLLLNARDPELTERLLQDTQDTDLLQRLSRKFEDQACLDVVERRLTSLREAQEKPLQLEKSLTLILSKLQALTDKSDFALIEQASASLRAEYESAWGDHHCLTDVLQQSFTEKYQRISRQVERHLENIRPQWEARQAAVAQQQQISEMQALLKTATSSVDSLYEERLCEATLKDVESVSQDVRLLEEKAETLRQMSEDTAGIKRLLLAQKALTDKLDAFSAQQQLAIKAVNILEELEALSSKSEDSDTSETFAALSAKWRELSTHLKHVPADWKARWRESQRAVKAQESAERAQADQRIKQCRKHINAVVNLIDKGRFRAAMARFQKLDEQYQQLTEKEKSPLSRRFEQAQQDVQRLEGWQSYLAAPRRPALIDEARALAASEPESIAQRAEAIRYLRKQWQSLNVPGGDNQEEQATFDTLLEQAFAPCREHYAELEKQREQATTERNALVDAAKQLDVNIAPASVYQQLDKLKQQWRQSGQVDKQTYETLKQAFDDALAPAQDVIASWQQENRQKKQKLVEEARTLSVHDDVFEAAEQAQALQKQWKGIEHAGRRYETRLWQAFKDANDTVFAKLKTARAQQRNESNAELDIFLRKAQDVQQQLHSDNPGNSAQALDDLQALADSLPRNAKGQAEKKLNALHKTFQREQQKRAEDRSRKRYQVLADVIKELTEHSVSSLDTDLVSELDKTWQDALRGSDVAKRERHWLTTALEVILDLPSGPADSELRKTVQLALLTAKLERGESWDKDDLLAQWLSHGKVGEQDLPLIPRINECLNLLITGEPRQD
ncbi:DUF349 domain-containing protein [Alteromonas antoniana]|uniref:DUF349 domain-containing protein n=1 Tax=Alteromonas antoniana TaxID=2803813 RepID=UPI001C4622D9|nr:DUF349 domain-containing protein [Alteromonas antoniana]